LFEADDHDCGNMDNMSTVTPGFFTVAESMSNEPPYEIVIEDDQPVIKSTLTASRSGRITRNPLTGQGGDVDASSTQLPSDSDSAKDAPNGSSKNKSDGNVDIEAQEKAKSPPKVPFYCQRRVQLGMVALLLLAGGAVGAVMALGVVGGGDDGGGIADDSTAAPTASAVPTPAPSQSPSAAPTAFDLNLFLNRLIPEYSQDAVQTTGSPQSKALSWLKSDPDAKDYSDERALERFGLATLFYATGRLDWVRFQHAASRATSAIELATDAGAGYLLYKI
jgi:hypothetical protein